VPNPILHWELAVNDVARSKAFYRRVFDWTFDDTMPGYTLIQTGKEPGGGMMAKPPAAPAPSLNTYFGVDEIDRTLLTVVEAGGTVIVPKTEIPHVGWFAMFTDLDGIPVGVLQELASRP
jgi:predicted enzyme related to lactoylglutathione lyase